ncbi:MAG: hypothetical protein FWE22_03900 [Firmicutes bacterium]|nr:hypothetical protein [Bacillota bacterium]
MEIRGSTIFNENHYSLFFKLKKVRFLVGLVGSIIVFLGCAFGFIFGIIDEIPTIVIAFFAIVSVGFPLWIIIGWLKMFSQAKKSIGNKQIYSFSSDGVRVSIEGADGSAHGTIFARYSEFSQVFETADCFVFTISKAMYFLSKKDISNNKESSLLTFLQRHIDYSKFRHNTTTKFKESRTTNKLELTQNGDAGLKNKLNATFHAGTKLIKVFDLTVEFVPRKKIVAILMLILSFFGLSIVAIGIVVGVIAWLIAGAVIISIIGLGILVYVFFHGITNLGQKIIFCEKGIEKFFFNKSTFILYDEIQVEIKKNITYFRGSILRLKLSYDASLSATLFDRFSIYQKIGHAQRVYGRYVMSAKTKIANWLFRFFLVAFVLLTFLLVLPEHSVMPRANEDNTTQFTSTVQSVDGERGRIILTCDSRELDIPFRHVTDIEAGDIIIYRIFDRWNEHAWTWATFLSVNGEILITFEDFNQNRVGAILRVIGIIGAISVASGLTSLGFLLLRNNLIKKEKAALR